MQDYLVHWVQAKWSRSVRQAAANVLRWNLVAAAFAIMFFTLGANVSATTISADSVAAAASRIALMKSLESDEELLRIYSQRGFRPIWTETGDSGIERRQALIRALDLAPSHGLPAREPDIVALRKLFENDVLRRNRAFVEAEASRIYLSLAKDLHLGLLDPSEIVDGIKRKRRDVPLSRYFDGLDEGHAAGFIADLAPQDDGYLALRKELLRLEKIIAKGGWGDPVQASTIDENSRVHDVVALRNRLIRMGYMRRSLSPDFDGPLEHAVMHFQRIHGLEMTGRAGPKTVKAVNLSPEQRRAQVVAALERHRWMNKPLGDKHIVTNLADFHMQVVENGRPVYRSRVVVGKGKANTQTPEFTGKMTHMIVNPVWHVPYSIATEEILPELQEDPLAASELVIFDEEGNPVSRTETDFAAYSDSEFPFHLKQPPGPTNALGAVKFMFPNRHSIYMHDTPEKQFFERDVRTFSHGCIRVRDAEDFAAFLLSDQTVQPELLYENARRLGGEVRVNLEKPLPVHIVYRTVWVAEDGTAHYRQDIYGRDSVIFDRINRLTRMS